MENKEKKKHLTRKLIILIVLPLIFVAIPVSRYIINSLGEEESAAPTPVLASQPKSGTLKRQLSYSGNLTAENTNIVMTKIPGKVLDIMVKENQAVRRGEPLVQIEDEVVRLRMQQTLAAWESAQAQYEKALRGARKEEIENTRALVEQAEEDIEHARSAYERTKRLYEADTVAKSKYEEEERSYRSAQTKLENAKRSLSLIEEGASEEDLRMAKANAESAKKQYELAKLQLDYATVEAPVSGRVAEIMVEEGNTIGTSTPLIAIVNDNLIFADIAVPEKYYADFRNKGDSIRALVKPVAYPDQEAFTGQVTNVASIIDPRSRTFNVEIAVPNSANLLTPGMYVNVDLILSEIETDFLLPVTSVVYREGRQVVFIITEKNSYHVEMKPVKTGLSDSGMVQIIEGVGTDDQVVVQGNAFLEHGQQVRLIKES